ncbi:fimbrillin family protein [uncultured Bacteroides sp.]|uniref:fimbrillin family protein n=1 Tax=uncultured Bacteroides sp. TaxID=162156 RepID=UPI00258B9EE7|nr:fimbrillin family protein [uncultured Bacteroides sp.]
MKKILLAAVAALAIVGCTQNEEIENVGNKAEINFNGIVGKGTRAVEMNLDGLKAADKGFYVYAYNTGSDDAGTGVLDNPIMEGNKVTWDATVWKGSKTYYWPLTGKVQFFAYASSQSSTKLTTSTTDKYPAIVNYTVPALATDQEDLLVAQVTDKTKADGSTIIFTFSHALTQVNFSVKAKNDDGFNYVVSDISLSGIGNVATYTYGQSGAWGVPTATTGTYAYPINGENNTVTGTTAKPLDSSALMLLPQTLGDAAKIIIKYKVVDSKGNEYYATPEGGTEILIKDGIWGANKKMRYTLSLTNDATPIAWDVKGVDGWTTPETNEETNIDK